MEHQPLADRPRQRFQRRRGAHPGPSPSPLSLLILSFFLILLIFTQPQALESIDRGPGKVPYSLLHYGCGCHGLNLILGDIAEPSDDFLASLPANMSNALTHFKGVIIDIKVCISSLFFVFSCSPSSRL